MSDLARLAFRPATAADRTFVIASWLDAFRDELDAGMVSIDRWYPTMWPEIERILDRNGTTVIIAGPDDDPSLAYGFICADLTMSPPLVHFVYVKAFYRRWIPKPGIARQLFAAVGIDPSSPFDYSYRTSAVRHLASKIPLARHQRNLVRWPEGKGIRR